MKIYIPSLLSAFIKLECFQVHFSAYIYILFITSFSYKFINSGFFLSFQCIGFVKLLTIMKYISSFIYLYFIYYYYYYYYFPYYLWNFENYFHLEKARIRKFSSWSYKFCSCCSRVTFLLFFLFSFFVLYFKVLNAYYNTKILLMYAI